MATTQTRFQRIGIESIKVIKAAPAVTLLSYKLKQYMQQKCLRNIWVLNESGTTITLPNDFPKKIIFLENLRINLGHCAHW